MLDKHKAFMLSVALGCLEAVIEDERPKSARWNRINGVIDSVSRAVNIYRPEAWPIDDLVKANDLLDRINELIVEAYCE